MTAETLALILMIRNNHLPPHPNHIHYEAEMQVWQDRYEQARATAEQMLAATGDETR